MGGVNAFCSRRPKASPSPGSVNTLLPLTGQSWYYLQTQKMTLYSHLYTLYGPTGTNVETSPSFPDNVGRPVVFEITESKLNCLELGRNWTDSGNQWWCYRLWYLSLFLYSCHISPSTEISLYNFFLIFWTLATWSESCSHLWIAAAFQMYKLFFYDHHLALFCPFCWLWLLSHSLADTLPEGCNDFTHTSWQNIAIFARRAAASVCIFTLITTLKG